MASKSKTKAKKAAPKKAAKPRKSAARKSSSSKPKGKTTEVGNHNFAPGTTIRFLPVHRVTVERGMGREPFAAPDKTAKVTKNGKLSVTGLKKGMWCAAGPTGEGDEWRFVQFSVK